MLLKDANRPAQVIAWKLLIVKLSRRLIKLKINNFILIDNWS